MGREGNYPARRVILALLVAGFMCLGISALSDRASAAWSESYELNSNSDEGAEETGAAVDNGGNSVYVWVNTVDAGLMMNQVGAGGEPTPGSVGMISAPGQAADDPDVAMNGEGSGMAVWSDVTTRDILGVTFTAGGEPSEPFTIFEAPAGWASYEPEVSVAPDGDAYVAILTQNPGPPAESVINGVYVPAGGTPATPETLSGAGMYGSGHSIDVGGDDQFRVVWTEEDGTPGTVQGTTVSSTGTPGTAVQLSQGTDPVTAPQVATNHSGDSVVAYLQASAPPSSQAVRWKADGTVGDPQQLASAALIVSPPSVAIADNGDAIAASLMFPGPDGIAVYAVDIPATGPVSEPQLISMVGGLATAQVGMAGNGDVFATVNGPVETGGDYVIGVNTRQAGGEWSGIAAVDPRAAASAWTLDTARSGQTVVGWNALPAEGYRGAIGNRFASIASGPASVDFGAADIGTPVGAKPVVIENSGGSPLVVSGVSIAGDASADFSAGTGCDAKTLAPGDSCTVDVAFTPSVVGARTAELNVLSDSIGDPAPVALTGTGNALPPEPRAKVRIAKVTPKRSKIRRGKKKAVKVRVNNAGTATAKGVKVCLQPNRAARKKVKVSRCVKLGKIAAKKGKTATLRVTVKKRRNVRGKVSIPVKLSSNGAGRGSARIVVNIPR